MRHSGRTAAPCRALDLDRSSLFQLSEADHDLILTHQWIRPDLTPGPARFSATSAFPWSFAKLMAGEIASFSSPDEVPDVVERETIRRYSTKSRIALPFSIGGRIAGAIAFSSSRENRSWPPEIIARLRLVANVFGGALARRVADTALQMSEQRFRSFCDNAPVLIWVGGPNRSCTWFNRQWLDFVGHTMEHELGDGWTGNVHPDDFDSCLQTYTKSFDTRQPFSMEYRLRRHDGEWRWLLDHGLPNYAGDGTFAGYFGSCVDITEQRHVRREAERVRDQLRAENVYLRIEAKDRGTGVIIGQSDGIRRVLAQIEQVAGTDSTGAAVQEKPAREGLFATRILRTEQPARAADGARELLGDSSTLIE